MVNAQLKIEKITNPNDLELIVKGDVLEIIYQNEGRNFSEEAQVVVFYGETNGQLQFILPTEAAGTDYAIMYKARKSQITERDGKIVINEDRSFTESFKSDHPKYADINQTLINSGLRRAK